MQTPDTRRREEASARNAGEAVQHMLPEQAELEAKLREDAARSLALMAFWAVPLAHIRAFLARLRGRRD